MKLFTKYNRINILATVLIFLLAGTAFYFLVNYVVISQVDDGLNIKKKEIQAFAQKYNHLPERVMVNDQMINYTEINSPLNKSTFRTLILYDSLEKDTVPFRQLQFGIYNSTQWYRITISKSIEGMNDLIRSILLITSGTIFLILIVTFLINRFVLKRLWKPFYDALAAIRNFKIGQKQKPVFPDSHIDEFILMNNTMEKMTWQAQNDYSILKEFTENASHEMQTPLAVIRSKLDMMIQDEHLTEFQSSTLQSTFTALQKLSRLNQSLLLLAKIENRQFEETDTIDIKNKIQEKTEEFRELWQVHNLHLSTEMNHINIKMNPHLADILLNNLLSNAAKHNYKGGTIHIELNQEYLSVSNTSNQSPLDSGKMFQRFYKPTQENESNGLGLSIIKQICDVSAFTVRYNFGKEYHKFLIQWNGRIC